MLCENYFHNLFRKLFGKSIANIITMSSKHLFQTSAIEAAIDAYLATATTLRQMLKSPPDRNDVAAVRSFMSSLYDLSKKLQEHEKVLVGSVRESPRDAHTFILGAEKREYVDDKFVNTLDTDSYSWKLYQCFGFICRDTGYGKNAEMPIGSFGNADTQLKLFEIYFPELESDSESEAEADSEAEAESDLLVRNLKHRLFRFGFETRRSAGGKIYSGFEMDRGFVDSFTLSWLAQPMEK